jgi:hypothetical protein
MSGHLAELAEAEAQGAVADTYADIRATLGLPVVNLVYRHLATEPGRLEALWAGVVPALRDPAAARLAAGIAASAAAPAVDTIPAAALAAAGIDGPVLDGLARTLAAYDRGNAVNLLAITATLEGVGGRAPTAPGAVTPNGDEGPAPPAPLPPMVAVDRLYPAARALVEEMSEAVSGPVRPLLVPSLFRHLTRPAALLPLAWTVLRSPLRAPAFDAAVERVTAAAHAAARDLPAPVPRVADDGARAALEPFVRAVPRMLVVSAMLREAFAEGAP